MTFKRESRIFPSRAGEYELIAWLELAGQSSHFDGSACHMLLTVAKVAGFELGESRINGALKIQSECLWQVG
jgi:hypothetical protein